jgi:hypothetical protein
MDNSEILTWLQTQYTGQRQTKQNKSIKHTQHRNLSRWVNKGNDKITELWTILQRESQNS